MTALSLSQTYTAIGPGATASFLAAGGKKPYVYSVVTGGAGGTIDRRTGVYTAPAVLGSSPSHTFDTVQVTDALSAVATATIVVGNALLLFCDIIQTELGLANGRVYLWDQKIFQPQDYDLYVAISVPSCKAFGNNIVYSDDGLGNYTTSQSVNMKAMVDIDIISRGPAARDRKEEVLMALSSAYAESQMEKNSFYIGKISTNFINISSVDGAAIPYRYKISCSLQYAVSKNTNINYYSIFQDASLTIDN